MISESANYLQIAGSFDEDLDGKVDNRLVKKRKGNKSKFLSDFYSTDSTLF